MDLTLAQTHISTKHPKLLNPGQPCGTNHCITASPSLVASAKDARSWLKNKGWLLPSEENSKSKLVDILLSATLSFKLQAKASTAICSVAFLLWDQSDEDFTSTATDAIIEKVIDKISVPLGTLNVSVAAAKEFLDATLQKHASELLELQDSMKQQVELVKSIAETAEKLAQNPNLRGLADTAWPLLSGSNRQSTQGQSSLPLHRGSSQADPKIIQRVSLAAKQLLIEYGPLNEGERPHPKSADSQKEM